MLHLNYCAVDVYADRLLIKLEFKFHFVHHLFVLIEFPCSVRRFPFAPLWRLFESLEFLGRKQSCANKSIEDFNLVASVERNNTRLMLPEEQVESRFEQIEQVVGSRLFLPERCFQPA